MRMLTDENAHISFVELVAAIQSELAAINAELDANTAVDQLRWIFGRGSLIERRQERLRLLGKYSTAVRGGIAALQSFDEEQLSHAVMQEVAAIVMQLWKNIAINQRVIDLVEDTINLIETGWL